MTTPLDTVRQALHGRYAVESELGRGGMATVYAAHDAKHERRVAIKVLRPELAASLGAARFLQEIKLAAGLTHPHILPLHDSGEAQGLLFYVMPYVEGESLRDRLARDKQLGIEEAVAIAREIADALGHAHSRGIVHRDIKPENILFVSRHAVLSDFGIARAISAAGGEQLTETGLVIGTPAYMSPEQAAGSEVDARSDLYSLGCVLYEMLGGEPPFTGPTPRAVLARHAIDPMPPLSTIRATVPVHLEAALARVLAKVPADRFKTAAQFAEALSASEAAVAPRASGAAAAERSIAVLPFTNMSADPDNEYFSDGMTEEITNALTVLPGVHVAARTSAFAYKGKNANLRRVGQELHVATVLEGSVRRAGDRVRVTAQLINISDGYHLWSERFDRTMDDVFAIQDEIAAAIVDKLKVTLTGGAQQGIINRGTENLEAHQLYWRGRHCWNTRQLPEALKFFQEATAHDPHYALPYAGTADVFSYLAHYGLIPTFDAATKARAAAERAVSLAPDVSDTHCSLGMAQLFFWEVFESEAEFLRAVELNPSHGLAHAYLAVFYGTTGQRAKAVPQAHRATDVEPLSAIVHAVAGIALFWAHDFGPAIASCQRALQLDSTMLPAVYMLGLSLSALGQHDQAVATLEKAANALPCPLVLAQLGGAYAAGGQAGQANEILERLLNKAKTDFAPAMHIGYIYAKLGELDQAFEWLAKGFDQRNSFVWGGNTWPGFEHVGADPRYTALLEKAGLGALAVRTSADLLES